MVLEKLSGNCPKEPNGFRALRPQPVSEGADYTDLSFVGKGRGGLETGGIAAWNDGQNLTEDRMRRLALVVGAALALGGCEQMCGAAGPKPAVPLAQACAKPFERTVSFTSAQPNDRLVVEALGPDCSNPAILARVFDSNGRLVYAEMESGKLLMSVEGFPPGGGSAQGAVEAAYDIGGPNSLNLPAWLGGPAPAPAPYGAFEVLVPQPAYERLRRLNAPTLIKRGGFESGTIYIYDPENAHAVAVAKFAV